MKEIATILGVPVVPYTMDETVTKLTQDTLKNKRNFVVTANAEIIMMAQGDKEYKTLLAETADLILPDGAGTVWAGNYLGYTIPERVAGYDLYLRLLEEAAKNNIPVYFFGGKPGIAEEAAEEGKHRWPGLNVAGCRNGYFSAEEEPGIIEHQAEQNKNDIYQWIRNTIGTDNDGIILFLSESNQIRSQALDHYCKGKYQRQ